MTPIADMVETMLARGVTHEMVVLAIRTAEMSGTNVRVTSKDIQGQSEDVDADAVLEQRRSADRDRKKAARLLVKHGGGKQTMSASASEDLSKDSPRTSEDTTKDRCNLSSLLTTSVAPLEKQESKTVVIGRRGTRLAADWTPSPEDFLFARTLGMLPARIDQAAAEFRDFWIGVPGSRGLKLDWPATWRNRLREICGVSAKQQGKTNGKRTVQDAAHDLHERIQAFNERPAGGICEPAGEADVRLLPPRGRQ